MNQFRLFKVIERLAAKGWRGTLESTRRLMGLYTKVLLCVLGSLTTGHCLAVYSMSREIIRLYRRSGPLFLGQYLKQVHFSLCWYLAKADEPRPPLKTFVSLTRSGIPRFIPPMYRKKIRRGEGDSEIRIVLSVCSLSRLLKVTPKGGLRVNPASIHQPNFSLSQSAKDLCVTLVTSGFSMISAYAPFYRQIPLRLGFDFKPMFTSGPNTYKDYLRESRLRIIDARARSGLKKLSLTIYHTLPVDATALFTLFKPERLAFLGSVWFHDREVYPDSGYDNPVIPEEPGTLGFGALILELISPAKNLWWDTMKTRPENGRFGRKLEGSGKIRVFAIANPILQTLLRPLHDWVMSVLKLLPTDGTYNQLAPLSRLKGKKDLYSFDLKSATDLLPADLSASLLVSLFGDEFGSSWLSMMTEVAFRSPERLTSEQKARVYRFTRGQPLGYYSSWPVFTLTHHILVWLSAYEVYPGKRFTDYAILGDDLVIADHRVALAYRNTMSRAMGVISVEKSLISRQGVCEFAKRFIVNNHREDRADLSPVSLACLRACSGFVASFVFKTLGASYRSSFRIRGGGYRVFSRLRGPSDLKVFQRLSRRWKRHWLTLYAPSGIIPLPFSLWLAFPERGILTCYELGAVRMFILERVKPRDIDENSINELNLFWEPFDQGFMLERLLKSFVSLHLNYYRWYAQRVCDFSGSLDDLMKPPVAPIRIERVSDESTISRYGLAFKTWDFIRILDAPKPLAPLGRTPSLCIKTEVWRLARKSSPSDDENRGGPLSKGLEGIQI